MVTANEDAKKMEVGKRKPVHLLQDQEMNM